MGERWRPSADFEDEMMSIQPDCDLIFPENDNNPASLAAINLDEDFRDLLIEEGPRMPLEKSKELLLVGKIREKVPGLKIVGRLLTEEDLNIGDREAETIAMIRDVGSAPCYDFPLKSKTTLPTISSSERYKVTPNGNIPLLLDPEFFKLKPKSSSSDASTSKSSDDTNSSTDTSSMSLNFRTFTIFDDDSKSLSDDNADEKSTGESIPPPPPPPSSSPVLRNGVAKKLKEQSRAEQNMSKNATKNKENLTKFRHNNFMTPKELYLKKRGCKS